MDVIREYGLLIVAVLLVASGVCFYSPGAALVVLGCGCGFIWWDSDEADQ